jgi:hypothetical protein
MDLPKATRDEVRTRLGGDAIAAIEGYLPIGWAPMSLHMRLSDVVRDLVGPARNVDVWHVTMTAALARPLLRGFVQASIDLFGLTPVAFLRQSDRIYTHLTRDLGVVRFELEGRQPSEDSSGNVDLTGFPADRYRFICFVEGLLGCIQSFLATGTQTTHVVVADVDERRGRVRYRVTW